MMEASEELVDAGLIGHMVTVVPIYVAVQSPMGC